MEHKMSNYRLYTWHTQLQSAVTTDATVTFHGNYPILIHTPYVIGRDTVYCVCMYSYGFLSRGFTDLREILHGGLAWSRTGLLLFWGDSRILGFNRAPYGGICFLLKHCILLYCFIVYRPTVYCFWMHYLLCLCYLILWHKTEIRLSLLYLKAETAMHQTLQTNGGARVFAGLGKRLCCRPRLYQISSAISVFFRISDTGVWTNRRGSPSSLTSLSISPSHFPPPLLNHL